MQLHAWAILGPEFSFGKWQLVNSRVGALKMKSPEKRKEKRQPGLQKRLGNRKTTGSVCGEKSQKKGQMAGRRTNGKAQKEHLGPSIVLFGTFATTNPGPNEFRLCVKVHGTTRSQRARLLYLEPAVSLSFAWLSCLCGSCSRGKGLAGTLGSCTVGGWTKRRT